MMSALSVMALPRVDAFRQLRATRVDSWFISTQVTWSIKTAFHIGIRQSLPLPERSIYAHTYDVAVGINLE